MKTDARKDTVPWSLKPGTGESGTRDHMAFQSRVYLPPMASGFSTTPRKD